MNDNQTISQEEMDLAIELRNSISRHVSDAILNSIPDGSSQFVIGEVHFGCMWIIVFTLAMAGMPSEVIHTCVHDAIVKAEMIRTNGGSSLILH